MQRWRVTYSRSSVLTDSAARKTEKTRALICKASSSSSSCLGNPSEDMSVAAIAARRALQEQRVRVLYRRALRNVLSYAVHRDIFYIEAQKMREQFEKNKNVANLETIDRLLYEGESMVEKLQHPDPYIVPWAPGGSKWARNPPVPPEIGVVFDFGRQENL